MKLFGDKAHEGPKMLIFALFDSKAEAYLRPFFAETRGLGMRAIMEAARDESSPLGKYPADFTLFEIGVYYTLSGKLEPHGSFENLGNGLSFKEMSER